VTTGAERLIATSVRNGVDVCFTNPGTTEMSIVAALDTVPGMRAVLGLFEGVVTGAADGYGRIKGTPACTLLHLGPGLANGIANLHNARRANTPIVSIVGDHATWHLAADSPITTDIATVASPASPWVRHVATPADMAADTASAIAAALTGPGQVATLVVPADCQWGEAPDGDLPEAVPPSREAAPDDLVAAAAKALAGGESTVLFVGGPALDARGLRTIERIRVATGCKVFGEVFSARTERGRDVPWFRTLPYFPERAVEALAGTQAMVVVGAPVPVAFFGYPGMDRSEIAPPECEVLTLADAAADVTTSLEALADAVGAAATVTLDERAPVEVPTGQGLSPKTIGQAVVALMPEHAIVVEEATTGGVGYTLKAPSAPPHTSLAITGGAIGFGLPCALGAAVAAPDRRVISLQSDGAAMYTSSALWSMAREGVDVTVVLFANRKYAILQAELERAGVKEFGPIAQSLTDLHQPELDFVKLAEGQGVPAGRATTTDEFVALLQRSLATPGPFLIEAVIG
jgi:acetolactate synthase-1/2/3 large subunit